MLELLVLFLVLVTAYELYWKRRNLPPGPTPLPFIGNVHTVFFHEPGYSAYEMWRKKYGPIYTYWLGPIPFVMISDYKSLKDSFVRDGDAYTGKYHFEEITKEYRGGQYGVVDTVGDAWREHRRFALHVLKDLGLSKNVMEQRIHAEVEAMTDRLMASKRCVVEMQDVLDVCVGSVINQVLFGYRFDEDHIGEFRELKSMISRQMRETAHPSVLFLFMFPMVKYLPYFRGLWSKLMAYRDAFYDFFNRQIESHRLEMDYSSQSFKDYVEAYLKEKRTRELVGDHESFSHNQLLNMCLDLWFAGMETTSNTLSWAVVYILNHANVQIKLHEELDRVIGSNRLITMADKSSLPYTNAVINEVQRMANLLPQNLPHETTRPVQVGKWSLPAKTGVIPQISNVLYDHEVFPAPLAFDPSRFIDQGGRLKKVEELIPFSIGKRQCLGEGLARMELFLFTANLFNRFELSCVDPREPPTMKKTFGTTMQAQKYYCIATPRF